MDPLIKNITDFYEKIATEYDDWEKHNTPIGNIKEERKSIREMLSVKKGDRLLDVGTGTGYYLILAAKKGAECYGVDISRKMIEITRKKCEKEKIKNYKLFLGKIDDFNFKRNYFDWVTCIGVLENYNLDYIERLLSKFNSMVKNNGRVIVDFLNSESEESWVLKKTANKFKVPIKIHNIKEIKNVIEKSGFKIIKMKKPSMYLQFLLEKTKTN